MTNLANRAYHFLKQVPKGKVTTYKYLAHAVGTKAYRAIGQAMRHNPYAPEVPCHRVVASNGTLGGFMGKRDGAEMEKKTKLLQSEGVTVKDNKVIDFKNILHTFST